MCLGLWGSGLFHHRYSAIVSPHCEQGSSPLNLGPPSWVCWLMYCPSAEMSPRALLSAFEG